MATTLQELRKEAGYRTAKDFAEALDVPPTTYARYEQSPDKIPLKQAWLIADKLDCSIDAVVGREHVEVSEMRGEIQRFYDDVSDENKHLLDEFIDFIKSKERSAQHRKRFAEERRYEELVRHYNRLFFESKEFDEDFANQALFGDPFRAKSEFMQFVEETMIDEAEKEFNKSMTETEALIRKRKIISIRNVEEDNGEVHTFRKSDPDYEEKLDRFFAQTREEFDEKSREERRVELEKISDAYDRMRRRRNASIHSRSDYYYHQMNPPLS